MSTAPQGSSPPSPLRSGLAHENSNLEPTRSRPAAAVPLRPCETIAVIIPTALMGGFGGRPLVVSCLESLLPAVESSKGMASDGRPRVREVVLVTQGRPLEDAVIERLQLAGVDARQLDVLGSFNFSRKINAGAATATSDVLFLLNDDAQVRGDDWPEVFLDILADQSIAAVGPVIVNPDGTLNAAGDALLRDGARHVDEFDVRFRPGLAAMLTRDHDVSLLTAAALALPLPVFRAMGGFDEAYPASFGDTDLCLRLRASDQRLVCTPRIVVVHHESSSRDPKVPASTVRLLRLAHRDALRDDPLLPPLSLPARVRVGRALAPSLRSAYRLTLKRFVPSGGRRRLWRAAEARGWFK